MAGGSDGPSPGYYHACDGIYGVVNLLISLPTRKVVFYAK